MTTGTLRMRWAVAAMAFCALCGAAADSRPEAPSFQREVRPILSGHCFKCHGPDDRQRQAGLRLDSREAAARVLKPGKSELVRRILLNGPGQMPPPHANKPLSDAQKRILQRWVDAGAPYEPHWAFLPIRRPPVPAIRSGAVIRNPIDAFIVARLEEAGLKQAPEADRYTLIRRVSLDLIGLTPTPEEVDAFVTDRSEQAYEKLVDRLLASPHYGERWARRWLDLARYADTNGYEKDRPRSMWPWRDWVINALNSDMPFDQFTIEQIAGDMLPHATQEQKIATGFHRNTMINEEGGIDPQEFRFHAMTDRVATTGVVWLGLTLGCAQCHTHKFDPITQKEYYRLFALLNNADEPEMAVIRPDIADRRREMEAQIAARERDLPLRFPPEESIRWHVPNIVELQTESGASAEKLGDGSVRIAGRDAETDSYTLLLNPQVSEIAALKVEALTDSSLGGNGPGRTPHGNFVVSEVSASILGLQGESGSALKFSGAIADFAQDGFPASAAIDRNLKTGWAIHGPGAWNVNRSLTLSLAEPVSLPTGARLRVKLDQAHGQRHTLGRFRILLGEALRDDRPLEARRRAHLERRLGEWLKQQEARAVRWSVARPVKAVSNMPLLIPLPDGSIRASGDQSKRDVYDVDFEAEARGIRAIRLEVLPDTSLPNRGPGRVYYEGPNGDFFLSEMTMTAGGKPVRLEGATHSYASGANGAPGVIDGDPLTGWSINGGQGRAHTAVFRLTEPLDAGGFHLNFVFERYYAAGLGRFRVSVSSDAKPAEAGLPADVEEILLVPDDRRTEAQKERLLSHFVSIAPELAAERAEIEKLRSQMPAFPTTLVMAERPPENPRVTTMFHRGEFLQPGERVTPGVPAILPPLPPGAPANRLTFARWLVDSRNPLTARVAANRQWAAFFGVGLVRTLEDFGYQGEAPSHPELLDWLASELMRPEPPAPRWSMKRLHRLIVTSATYRQSAAITPQAAARDPGNQLLSRAPRRRMEAEMVRDSILTASGQLSRRMFGPSVFPPQPPGITTQGVYGPLEWKVSEGEDRYRRGLYTFLKRTAPYAMFNTFDGPSGEACIARREVSNTPLQALTLLNDEVVLDAARALGKMLEARPGAIAERLDYLFRRCLARPPTAEEKRALLRFFENQRERAEAGEFDASALAGPGGNIAERAAWTALARALLNLDEFITRS